MKNHKIKLSTYEARRLADGVLAWNLQFAGKPLPEVVQYQMFIVSNFYAELNRRLTVALLEGRQELSLKLHTVQINALVNAIRETTVDVYLANVLLKLEPKAQKMMVYEIMA